MVETFAQLQTVLTTYTVTVSYDCSPPTKLIITAYKNSPEYAKNVAIKLSYKPHGTKTPQSPLKVYDQTCCRRPRHN